MNANFVLALLSSMFASLIVELIHDPLIGQLIEKVETKLSEFWHQWFTE